jgi:hypothetical protein
MAQDTHSAHLCLKDEACKEEQPSKRDGSDIIVVILYFTFRNKMAKIEAAGCHTCQTMRLETIRRWRLPLLHVWTASRQVPRGECGKCERNDELSTPLKPARVARLGRVTTWSGESWIAS